MKVFGYDKNDKEFDKIIELDLCNKKIKNIKKK